MNQNAQQVANWAARTINTGDMVLADGKISPAEYFPMLNALMGLSILIPIRKEALAEWKSQSAEEKAAMIEEANQTIDVRDDKLERKIEAGFAILVNIGTILGD